MSAKFRGAVYGLTAAAFWGGQYVVSDVVLQTIPPFAFLSVRLLIAISILGLMRRFSANRPPLTRTEVIRLLGIGIVGFGLSVGAQFVGTDKSTAVNGTLVTSASPAFILIFAALLLREKLTSVRIAAVGLATVGVVVIIDPANASFGSDTFFGDMALAFAALTWGLYSVLVRKVSEQLDTLVVSFYALIGGLFIAIPAAALELTARPIGQIDGGTILGTLYVGIVSTAVAMFLWNRAFALVDASIASLFFFAQPLVGTLLSALLLSQPMTPNLWVGSGFIIGGVCLSLIPANRLNRRSDTSRVTISNGFDTNIAPKEDFTHG